jgi:hypothetical protein
MVAERKPITAMARATGLSRPTIYRLIKEGQDEQACAAARAPSQGGDAIELVPEARCNSQV